jgi:uncharacterized membrane protein
MWIPEALLFGVTLFAALGCGLIAGVFFAFSAFVMKALARLVPSAGIAAMQSINVVVINPLFLGVFVGTALASLLAVIAALFRWHEPGSVYLLIGALLYVAGTFPVTIVFNVPWNNRLAAVSADNPESANVWANYVVKWTAWNHVRTVAALAAAAAFTLALCS